jgi:hypothetical protein
MGADHGAIENEVLHIRVISKMVIHIFPDFMVTLTGKAFVDAIPLAVLFG